MSSIKTGIEWTDKTWNPTTGCNKVSPGCAHCYAEALTKRFRHHFSQGFELTMYPERLDIPKKWKKPSRIFVNSMSDLFHEKISLDFLQQVFTTINQTPQHIYQILTKRPERMLEIASAVHWSDNIWLGVSVESQDYVSRIDILRKMDVKVRFLSCEPLLSPLSLNLEGIDWVIVGGESGNKSRPLQPEWVEDILRQCQEADVAFFFKQWGGRHSKANGRELNGKIWSEMPNI
jgi:hypothetical protein